MEAEPARDPGEEVGILNKYGHTSLGDKVSGGGQGGGNYIQPCRGSAGGHGT